MTPVLQVSALTKHYGSHRALGDIALSVMPGEFVAVLGPSGSGKTTLFRCISRLTEPDAGEILVDGQPFHRLGAGQPSRARRAIGLVFQQFNLIKRRSAFENVLAGRLAGIPTWRAISGIFPSKDRRAAWEALKIVGLSAQLHQRADTLSGGQQQRVAIARALAQESRIILADEPVASLDPETAVSILTLLSALCKTRGLAVLCTLHQPPLAERFADRLLDMRDGRLTPARVLSSAIPRTSFRAL
jgi:phosphonate transport system ATP-binding protein